MTIHSGQAIVATAIEQAHQASHILAYVPATQRSAAVQTISHQLKCRQDEVLEANTLDLETSREMAVPDLLLEWLKLTPERLQNVVSTLQMLSEVPDPVGQVMMAGLPTEQGQSYFQLMPLGVVAFVHESLPDLAVIAAGLCLRTGNSLVLKGGNEATYTNTVLSQIMQEAITTVGLPEACLTSFVGEPNCSLRDLVQQDHYISLVLPYGRPSWVEQVVRQCTAPVLRTAMGNCYLYWSPSGSLETVRHIILDSHLTQPDPINAIEKVLIHTQQNPSTLTMLWASLRERGFEIRGDATLVAEFPDICLAQAQEWNQAYLRRIVAFKAVPNLETAITWINKYSSGHADCLVTESYQESHRFALQADSASIYINASPRFHRRPRRGADIVLGMSNQKGYRRGSIGLEALTTTKQIIQGTGGT
jgi:glutamate-5-semialdehyde dehydrogenase